MIIVGFVSPVEPVTDGFKSVDINDSRANILSTASRAAHRDQWLALISQVSQIYSWLKGLGFHPLGLSPQSLNMLREFGGLR